MSWDSWREHGDDNELYSLCTLGDLFVLLPGALALKKFHSQLTSVLTECSQYLQKMHCVLSLLIHLCVSSRHSVIVNIYTFHY